MDLSHASPQLRRAVKLRQWAHQALRKGDWYETVRLNFQADIAYMGLDRPDAYLYRKWAFGKYSQYLFSKKDC